MLKEQFLAVLFYVYAAQIPKKHSRDWTKGNGLAQIQDCLQMALSGFLTVTTLFSSKTLTLGICFSLIYQARRQRWYRGGESQWELSVFTVTLLGTELLICHHQQLGWLLAAWGYSGLLDTSSDLASILRWVRASCRMDKCTPRSCRKRNICTQSTASRRLFK